MILCFCDVFKHEGKSFQNTEYIQKVENKQTKRAREHGQTSKVTLEIAFLNKFFINTAIAQGGRDGDTCEGTHKSFFRSEIKTTLHSKSCWCAKLLKRPTFHEMTVSLAVPSITLGQLKCMLILLGSLTPNANISLLPKPLLLFEWFSRSLCHGNETEKKELTLNSACSENTGTNICLCRHSQERLASRQDSLVVSGDLQEYKTQIFVSLSMAEVVLPS